MEIILFRHFETVYSKEHRICGRIDCSIISNQQVNISARVVSIVSNKRIVYYSSPLKRCIESVRLLDEQLKQVITESSITIVQQLIERDWGPLSGLTKNEVLAKFNADVENVKKRSAEIESDEKIRERVMEAIKTISKDKNCVPLVATHKGCICEFARYFGMSINKVGPGDFLILNI